MACCVDAAQDACWDSLSPDLVERIASFLELNEVACTLRLVNKAIAEVLQGWTTVRLSESVPHHAFAHRWAPEASTADLTLDQRRQLLGLTARTGDLPNLEVASRAAGCSLTEDTFNAAGTVPVCEWLLARSCPLNDQAAAESAAAAGRAATLRWMLRRTHNRRDVADCALAAAAAAGRSELFEEFLGEQRITSSALRDALCGAAAGGHVELFDRLLQLAHNFSPVYAQRIFVAAAYGLDLPALQRLYHTRLFGDELTAEAIAELFGPALAAAALLGPAPDWRAKCDWLETVGCRLGSSGDLLMSKADLPLDGGEGLSKRPDGAQRLARLLQHALGLPCWVLLHAVGVHGPPTALQYLRSEGMLTGATHTFWYKALRKGDLRVLKELAAAAAWDIGVEGVQIVAGHGHLHVLQWLEGPEARPEAAAALRQALTGAELMEWGVRSGSPQLVAWLRSRGAPWDARAFKAASEVGHVGMLEWLVAQGCPMETEGEAYVAAGRNGDFATLRALRRLGCPWGHGHAGGGTLSRAVCAGSRGKGCSLEVLTWLVAEGCPVDWHEVRVRAERRRDPEVRAWVEEQLQAQGEELQRRLQAQLRPELQQEQQLLQPARGDVQGGVTERQLQREEEAEGAELQQQWWRRWWWWH